MTDKKIYSIDIELPDGTSVTSGASDYDVKSYYNADIELPEGYVINDEGKTDHINRRTSSPEEEAAVQAKFKKEHMGMKAKTHLANTIIYIVLILMTVIWLLPFVCILLESFRVESTCRVGYIIPKVWGFDNYVNLFTKTNFLRWFGNTFFMGLVVAVLQTMIVLAVSYALSRLRFKGRKWLMNFMLILGMFPGFMSMTAIYFLLQAIFGKSQPDRAAISLILVYAGGAAMSYYVAKGFFDTVPKSLDEAARIDGASRFRIFRKIILPLSKPIVIYTILISFIAPWCDFIFASLITGTNQDNWTVAVGMRNWVAERANLNVKFTVFCAAAVVVAVPITALFMWLQKYYVQGVTGGAVKG